MYLSFKISRDWNSLDMRSTCVHERKSNILRFLIFFLSILQKTHVEVIPFVSHCPVSIEFISSEQKFETIIYANFKRSKYVVHM